MKTRWTALLLCMAVLLTTAPTAFAADPADSGFYSIGAADRVEILPVTADGQTVKAVSRNVDGEPGDELFYPGAQAIRVTLADTAPGKMYILTVAAGDTVYYADQQTGGGTVTFQAAFLLPDRPTDMLLSIGSNAAGFSKVSVPLSYTPEVQESTVPTDPSPDPSESPEPKTEMKTGYTDCLRDSACVMAAYSDLDRSAWYHDGVHFALENRVMNGVSDQTFDPNHATSRAMIVTMLWRMEGAPESDCEMTFADVPADTWYTEAVRWAASAHIVEGYSTKRFAPNDNVSREQLATILWRYARYKGTDKNTTGKTNLGIFIDAEYISRWAYDGMQWAVNAGLIIGVGNDKLSPATDASRAQVATMLMRYCTAIESTQ